MTVFDGSNYTSCLLRILCKPCKIKNLLRAYKTELYVVSSKVSDFSLKSIQSSGRPSLASCKEVVKPLVPHKIPTTPVWKYSQIHTCSVVSNSLDKLWNKCYFWKDVFPMKWNEQDCFPSTTAYRRRIQLVAAPPHRCSSLPCPSVQSCVAQSSVSALLLPPQIGALLQLLGLLLSSLIQYLTPLPRFPKGLHVYSFEYSIQVVWASF